MPRASLSDEIAAVRLVCERLDLGNVSPELLEAAHRTSLLIAPLAVVAKVESSGCDCRAARVRREIAVARHLAMKAPALAPLDERLAGPHVAASSIVTLWPFVTCDRASDDADAPLAAAALAAVHHGLLDYRGELPAYTRGLDRCWRTLSDDLALAALPRGDRDLLRAQFRRLRGEVEATAAARIPLHGDVHLGNLLIVGGGALWTDFEEACRGPRERDIAGLPPAAWPLFPDADQRLVARCADLQSVCVAAWCWTDPSPSGEVREAAAYHLERVRGFAS